MPILFVLVDSANFGVRRSKGASNDSQETGIGVAVNKQNA